MKKEKRMYDVHATVIGTKFLGTFEANSPEEAEKMAEDSDEMFISLCHQCSTECENADISELHVDKVVITRIDEDEQE